MQKVQKITNKMSFLSPKANSYRNIPPQSNDSPTQNQKSPQFRKSMMSLKPGELEHHLLLEIEFMKKDISDKNQQIANLKGKVEQFQKLTSDLYDLILDLENSTSMTFINSEQKQSNSIPSRELVKITRQALTELIKIHNDMPIRFESDFSKKATFIVNEINQKSEKIDEINSEREKILEQAKKLERLAKIQEEEIESLKAINDALQEQKSTIDAQHMTQNAIIQDQIQILKSNVKGLKQVARAKEEKNQKTITIANLPLKKKTLDTIKEDIEIQEEIDQLQKRIDRELEEHQTTTDELEVTKVDIERAKAVIEKFKQSLTKEQKETADNINNKLKLMIEQQREDFKRSMKNQRKANAELEKQKADLIEEERMLRNYLQSLEKQLQIQSQRLPSLSVLQHRYEPENQRFKGALRRSKQRAPDDSEMRTIKKAIFRLQNRKLVSKSVLVGKNLR